MDTNDDGKLSCAEIAAGLKAAGYGLADSEVAHLLRAVDADGSGSLDPQEFLAALMDWQKEQETAGPDRSYPLDEGGEGPERCNNLWRILFDKYDTNGDGIISRDEIALIMGVPEDSPVIFDVLREADGDHSGNIDFEEFKQVMNGSKSDRLGIYSQRKRGR